MVKVRTRAAVAMGVPVPVPVPVRVTHRPIMMLAPHASSFAQAGGYVHDMFTRGLKVTVSNPEQIPRFLVADCRNHQNGDLRLEHLEIPPGVTIRKVKGGWTDGNFLVGRAKRIRGKG